MKLFTCRFTHLTTLKSVLHLQTRCASKTKRNSKRYSDTLNLPHTTFPLSMKDGAATKREDEIRKMCEFDELYNWQAQTDREKQFVLHDGPPYANGNPHVGHAVNKILKDITTRYKLLNGYRIHYIPGWDCHGLPIEQKALAHIKADHTQLEPLMIRKTAREFAEKTIKRQRAAFKKWGVFADWKNCYYTFDKKYEVQQLEIFYQMYKKGLIYQSYMPVYWSPSSRTALAEAELEYHDNHESTAVYVKFPLLNMPEILRRDFNDDSKLFAVIWTTTPWTLVANKAICYNQGISYSVVEDTESDDIYLMAGSAVNKFMELSHRKLNTLFQLEGGCLSGLEYEHPLTGQIYPLLPASHVTDQKGSGLVHTAPAHGPEDFQVATHHALPVDCMVNEDGVFMSEVGEDLAGLKVLEAGNNKVLDLFSANILHQETYIHSYPYDWRTNKPVIIRASKQWFVDTSKIKHRAMELLKTVTIHPKSSGQGMLSQLEKRSYWCISRQRVWGVPIPVFYNEKTGEPLLNRAVIDHIKSVVAEHGTDCWWKLSKDELLPPDITQQSGIQEDTCFERGSDVLDIWFDSGSSWASVLKDTGDQADLYLEGLDQFGGWFQSSLLTSAAVRNNTPYRSLVVHGFTMDEEGKKMSKSLGNVVDPEVVINGGKDKQQNPAYGADVLRWWVARAGLDSKVYIGPNILQSCNEQLFKVRKMFRYLLGNVADFEPVDMRVDHEDMLPLDQFMLHHLHGLAQQVTSYYDQYQYNKILIAIEKFVTIQLSLYSNNTKDRMYCSPADDQGRRSAQTVQWIIIKALMSYIGPIVPHMAEEVYQALPGLLAEDSFFKTCWFETDPSWHQPDLALTFDLILNIRDTFNNVIDSELPVVFDVVICAKFNVFQRIKLLQEPMTSSNSALTEVLQCSTTSVLSQPPILIPDDSQFEEGKCVLKKPDGTDEVCGYLLVLLPAENFPCERCRRHTSSRHNMLCDRCTETLGDGWDR